MLQMSDCRASLINMLCLLGCFRKGKIGSRGDWAMCQRGENTERASEETSSWTQVYKGKRPFN